MLGMPKHVKAKKTTTRRIQLHVMLSVDERLWLEMHANDRGLSASDIVRLWIREMAKRVA